jgi:tetratricopeptide (TPR) repeat protein
MEHDLHLDALGCLFGTDKSSLGHRYLELYGPFLARFRNLAFNLIEIGVQDGYSLSVWHAFFPNAHIVGIDKVERCRQFARDRISVRIGDQGDPAFLERVATEFPPLIVIDDGSHQAHHIMVSLRALLPHVQAGGVYIIEDLAYHRPEVAAANAGRPGAENPVAFVAREAAMMLDGRVRDRAEDPFLAQLRARLDYLVAIPEAAIIALKPSTNQPDPSVVDELERHAARLGTAAAWARYGSYLRINNFSLARAEAACRKALAIDPGVETTYDELAIVLAGQGRPDEASDLLAGLAPRHPNRFWIWRQLGEYAVQAGRYQQARQALDRAVELQPRDFWVYVHRSALAEKQGDLAEALREAFAAQERAGPEMRSHVGSIIERLQRHAC